MWFHSMETVSGHLLGTYNFEVDPICFENLCTHGVMFSVASQSVKYLH